jgi:molybdate transport system substrate-binding protein
MYTIGFAITLAAPTASDAAEIKVLTSRAMNQVLTELAGAFQRTSEHKIALILAPPAEIRRRILNDEIVDVAMTGGAIIEDLVQQGKITPDSKLTLARVGVGVAVRAGSAKPDITSVEAFKRALLAARSIVYTDPAVSGASGIHFEKVLDRLGIARAAGHERDFGGNCHDRKRARRRQGFVELPDLACRRSGHKGDRHGTGRLVKV